MMHTTLRRFSHFAFLLAFVATFVGAPQLRAQTSASSSSTGSNPGMTPYASSSANTSFSNDSNSPALTLGTLPIDLTKVKRVKVAGILVSEAPLRVGNLDILAPIVGDESSLLQKLGATASRVAEKNIPGNINTPTENPQSFQLNMAPRAPLILTIGRATAYVAGQEQQLRAAPLVIGGKIYLPIFSIAPLLGAAARLQSDGTLNITPTVQSVEVFPAKGYTVVTVKTSAPIPEGAVTKATDDNPPKLYFDFAGFSMGFDAVNSTGERVVSAGLNEVAQVRAGMPQSFPDITRVVLDLKSDVASKITIQPLPDKTMFAVLIPNPQTKINPRDVTIPGPDNPPRPTDGSLRGVVIVVDAGHGGYDSGAPGSAILGSSTGLKGISPGVTRSAEKHYVLDMARRLRANLEKRGATVLMTRDGDYFVPLQRRVDFANAQRADIFFSIHIDSFVSSSSGTTTHFYTAQSQPLAREVQSELARATGIKNRGIKQSRFFVIRKTYMPSVLTESAFISNPSEEARLLNPNWRQRVADGMAQGISNYVRKYGVRN